jgi:hypothetical protein
MRLLSAAPRPGAGPHTWGTDTLDRLRNPSGTAYFLPLGRLAPGLYRLWIDGLDFSTRAGAEVIAADFEQLAHQGIEQVGERQVLAFRVYAPAKLYVRISAQGSMSLGRVELVPDLTGSGGDPGLGRQARLTCIKGAGKGTG